MSRLGVLGICAAILCGAGAMGAAAAITGSLKRTPLAPGERLPSFAVQPLHDGPAIERARRRAIVVFRPSCPHCARLLDALRSARFDWAACLGGQTGVEWMFISEAPRAETQGVVSGLEGLPIFVDASGDAIRALRVTHVPDWLVVSANGVVEHHEIGLSDPRAVREALGRICEEGALTWTR